MKVDELARKACEFVESLSLEIYGKARQVIWIMRQIAGAVDMLEMADRPDLQQAADVLATDGRGLSPQSHMERQEHEPARE